jgi:hypothetical protein
VTPVAHVGHWLAEVLYLAPVLVVVTWISVKAILDRRRERREELTRARADAGR